MLFVRIRSICKWETAKAASMATATLQMYCKSLPDTVARLSTNPDAHSGLSRSDLERKLEIVEKEYRASLQCSCIERELAESLRTSIFLPKTQLVHVVRSQIKDHAREIMIERAALRVLVGNPQQSGEALDVVKKNASSDLCTDLLRIQAGLQ
jgi:hypothetical protein